MKYPTAASGLLLRRTFGTRCFMEGKNLKRMPQKTSWAHPQVERGIFNWTLIYRQTELERTHKLLPVFRTWFTKMKWLPWVFQSLERRPRRQWARRINRLRSLSLSLSVCKDTQHGYFPHTGNYVVPVLVSADWFDFALTVAPQWRRQIGHDSCTIVTNEQFLPGCNGL